MPRRAMDLPQGTKLVTLRATILPLDLKTIRDYGNELDPPIVDNLSMILRALLAETRERLSRDRRS